MTGALSRVVHNFSRLASAQVLVRLLHFGLLAAIARMLGKEAVGGYATAISVALYFAMFADLGICPRLVREGSARPGSAANEFARSLTVKLALVLPTLLLLGAVLAILPYPGWVIELLAVFAVTSILQSFCQLNESLLRSREKMQVEAGASVLQGVILVGGSIVALWAGLDMIWVGWARLAGVGARFFTTLAAVRQEIPIRLTHRVSWDLLRSATPYAATSITSVAFGQIDVVILSLIASQELVGEYASVSRLLIAVGAFAITGSNTALPAAARIFAQRGERVLRDVMVSAFRMGAALGAASTVGLALIGGPILRFVYGDDFADLEVPFVLGSLYILFKTLTSIFGMGLTARGLQAARARCIVIGIVATAILVTTLVPPFGVIGAVGALVGSEAVLWSTSLLAGRRFLLDRTASATALSLTASMAAAALGWPFIRELGPWAAFGACGSAFALGLVLTGEVGRLRRAVQAIAGAGETSASTAGIE